MGDVAVVAHGPVGDFTFSVWVNRTAMSMPAISFAISASDFLDMFFLRRKEQR
jgi:hypothetical protein